MSGKSIAVVGGGIGGVSAALNLLRAGFDVHVYEQSRALREVGAGIRTQIYSKTSRLLTTSIRPQTMFEVLFYDANGGFFNSAGVSSNWAIARLAANSRRRLALWP